MTDKIREYVSEKTSYYMPKYEKLTLSGKKVSWNWAAFWAPHYWMAYRKMYVEAVIYFIFWKVMSLLSDVMIVFMRQTGRIMPALFFMVIDIALMFVVPMFANYYYLSKMERFAVAEDTMTDGQINSQRIRYAGVNKIAVWIAIVLTLLWAFILW